MKKLTVFFVLLLCVSFTDVSAQTIRWEVSNRNTLQIRINGDLLVNVVSDGTNVATGILYVEAGEEVDVYAWDHSGNPSSTLFPIISEDDPTMIEWGASAEYNYLNEEHTAFREWFTMPDDIPMYVGINS